ncbi:uncharacterized protein LOC120356815 [Solenopsis invicta]|uniref:uncharacterized protein LOC120356815 n=1 Tax=Solenopsis invicta TaxID=13686 RepID=UPI00193CEBC1|nr:uncharacterized protein LOC120356815 [Solenopsis invicta]
MGLDYVEGVQCPDSFPEEQAEAMNLLTAGDDEILNIIPEPLTIRDNINDVIMEHDVNCIVLDATGEPLGEGSTLNIIQTDSQIKNVETAKQPHHCETTESLSGFPINEDIPQSLITVTQGSSKKRRAPQNTRRNTERLGTQLQNAREDFATLAERQISCMEMFAKAMQQIADNEKDRNDCLRAFIEAENSREKTYSELMIVVKNCVEILKNKSDL